MSVTRRVLGSLLLFPAACLCAAAAQPDKGAALEKAKAKFEADTAKADEALLAALDKAVAAARTKGPKAAAEKLEYEKEQFVSGRVIPTGVPAAAYLKQRAHAVAALDAAYGPAVKVLVKAKRGAEAEALEAEWADLLKSARGYGTAFPDLEAKPVVHIESRGTGLVIDTTNARGTGELLLVPKEGRKKKTQCWTVEREPKGYVFRNQASGQVMNVWDRSSQVGNKVHTWQQDPAKDTDPASLFAVTELGRDLVLRPSFNDLALVAGERKVKGVTTEFVTQDKRGDPPPANQRWVLVEAK